MQRPRRSGRALEPGATIRPATRLNYFETRIATVEAGAGSAAGTGMACAITGPWRKGSL